MTYPRGTTGTGTRAALVALAVLLGGCAAPQMVTKKEPQLCELPAAAVLPVEPCAPLTKAATNEDLWNRAACLEAALEKCNQRLVEAPSALKSSPVPETPRAPSVWERIRSVF
jgi:hypothetical protein